MSVDKKPVLVPLETPISQVSAGNLFSVAVEEGGSRVFLWGTFNSFGSSITAHPTEVQSITALLKRHHTKVKKIVACEQAVAFLTENGKLFVFGDSNQGQLGINQIRGMIY